MHLEWLPSIERLGESVGHHDECGEVEAESAVAPVDLNVLACLGVVIETVGPAHDTVGAGIDRGGRHREVVAHIGRHPHLEVWGVEVSERPVGQARVRVGGCLDLERAAHRDHLPDRVRRNPS